MTHKELEILAYDVARELEALYGDEVRGPFVLEAFYQVIHAARQEIVPLLHTLSEERDRLAAELTILRGVP